MRQLTISVFLIWFTLITNAQENVLDNYVNHALESNIALKQKNYSYDKSLEALKEAKRMYLPVVSIEARYSRAQGGRTAVVPFGELMNPAYNNLDVINQSMALANPSYPEFPDYPEVQDYELNFIREKEHETKVQVVMPVFNSAIINNHLIKKELTDVEKINVDIYKRELAKEVKSAYINYLRTIQKVELYENTLKLVEENLRNTQSLFEHEKITKDELFAARAHVKEIEKDLTEANKDEVMTKAFFNFLLNRKYNAEIEVATLETIGIATTSLDSLQTLAIDNREEMLQAIKYLDINTQQVKNQKGQALPEISLYASYGYQGESYSFTDEYNFGQAGLKLSWEIFNSGQRRAKVQQAKIDLDITKEKKYELERQIEMEVLDAYYSIETAKQGVELAKEEVANYKQAYELILKKYNRGMVNHLEYSNALNNLLNAENKLLLANYEYYLKQIELERVVAENNINN